MVSCVKMDFEPEHASRPWPTSWWVGHLRTMINICSCLRWAEDFWQTVSRLEKRWDTAKSETLWNFETWQVVDGGLCDLSAEGNASYNERRADKNRTQKAGGSVCTEYGRKFLPETTSLKLCHILEYTTEGFWFGLPSSCQVFLYVHHYHEAIAQETQRSSHPPKISAEKMGTEVRLMMTPQPSMCCWHLNVD